MSSALPSLYRKYQRPLAPVLAGAVGILILSGCSKGSGENQSSPTTQSPPAATSTSAPRTPAAIEQKCQPVEPDKWQGFPRNFDPNVVASRLGVSAVSLVTAGRFGAATCPEPVTVARIGTPDSPVVGVQDEGFPCVVIGTAEDPRTITETPNILAVCAPNGPATLPTT